MTAASILIPFLPCALWHWFSIGLAVKFLRASDRHSAAETSISGAVHRKLMFQTQHLATPGVAVHRKLMFHAQFSGITGELYAVGPIFLLSKRNMEKKRPKGPALNSHGEFNGVKHSLPGSGPPMNASPADSNLSRADLEVDVYVRLSQPAVPQ